MTLTISLSPELEKKLQVRASANGQQVAEFVVQTLEERLRGQPSTDELLAPFRRHVQTSGLSDEEFTTFFEEVRDEVWREKHGPGA